MVEFQDKATQISFIHPQINCQVIVAGPCHHARGHTVYQQYLNWIWKCNLEAMSLYERHSGGLEDTLQVDTQVLCRYSLLLPLFASS